MLVEWPEDNWNGRSVVGLERFNENVQFAEVIVIGFVVLTTGEDFPYAVSGRVPRTLPVYGIGGMPTDGIDAPRDRKLR